MDFNFPKNAGLALVVASIFVSACTPLRERNEAEERGITNRADNLIPQAGKVVAKDPVATAYSKKSDGIWISSEIKRRQRTEALPAFFDEKVSFNYRGTTLAEFAAQVAKITNASTTVLPDAEYVSKIIAAGGSLIAGQGVGGIGGIPAPGMPMQAGTPIPSMVPGIGGVGGVVGGVGAQGALGYGYPVNIVVEHRNGTVRSLLDAISARFGVFWRYNQDAIQFYFLDTRTFNMAALPGDTSLSSVISSGSQQGSSASSGSDSTAGSAVTGTNSQDTRSVFQMNIWKELDLAIKGMLTKSPAFAQQVGVTISPATGTITVTDTPAVLSRVEKFVEQQNDILSRQVMVNVTILTVSGEEVDEFGVNWNLMYQTLDNKFGIKNSFQTNSTSSGFSFGVINPGSRFNGTELVINVLNQQGNVYLNRSTSVVTLNNRPAPIQIARQTAYLQSSTTTSTQQSTSTSLTPGTVTSGFNMVVVPNIMKSGNIMLQFATDNSQLRNIRTVASGGASIESPEVDTRNTSQQVMMRSGETLIISGIDQLDGALTDSGVGSPRNFLLGGGTKARRGTEKYVILITPVITRTL